MSDLEWIDQGRCPVYATFFGGMGCCMALVLSVMGSAYGVAKAGVGVSAVSVLRPDMIVRNLTAPILASVLSIYGLVVSIIISTALQEKSALHTNLMYMAAGLAVGLSCLAAGFCIGILGDAGVRGTAQQPRLFMGVTMLLILGEALGIYGLIVALLMIQGSAQGVTQCL